MLSKSRNRSSCGLMPATFALDLLERQQRTLLRLAARIADHAGAAADERDRRVTEPLQPRETHHRQQRSDVQARRGRIEADVRGHPLAGERVGEPFRRRRTPGRATSARRRDSSSGQRVTIPADGCRLAAPCSRRLPRPASARSPAPGSTASRTSAMQLEITRADVPVTRSARRARRTDASA